MADTMGTTQNANFIPEVWANRALGKLKAELVMARTIARAEDFGFNQVGDTLHIPKRGTLTANDKAAGTAVTLQNPTATKIDVTLNKHKEVTFAIEDVAEAQQNQNVMDGYIEDAIKVLAEQIETDLAGLYSGLSQSVGSAGTDITLATVRSARSTLASARAPRTNRIMMLEPSQINYLLSQNAIIDTSAYDSNEPIRNGFVGRAYGFDIFESLFVQDDGSSPVGTHNLAYHRDAFVLAMRALPLPKVDGVNAFVAVEDGLAIRVVHSYNADQLAEQVTLDVLYGYAEMRDELAVDVVS